MKYNCTVSYVKKAEQDEYTAIAASKNENKTDDVAMENEGVVPPWRTCIVLSSAFFFAYTAFEAIQNLQSSLNHNNNLGVTSLAVAYLCAILGAVTGPASAKIFGPKRLVQIAFILQLGYIMCNFHPSFAIFIPMSACMGLGLGVLGMCLGLYLAASGNSYMIINNLKPELHHGILSMFNGVFYFSYKGTQISGNLVSSLVLFSSPYNDTLMEDNVCGAEMCATFHNSTVIERPEERVVYVLLVAFILCNIIGFTITFSLPTLNVGSDHPDLSSSKALVRNLGGCIRETFSFRFLLLMPMFIGQAMAVMIMYTAYTEAFVTCTIGIQWVGYAMVSLGVVSAVSSLTVNSVARYVGRPVVFLVGITVDIGILIVMLVWVPDRHTVKHLLFILPAVAGFSEGIMQPQFNALIASVFKENLPSAYCAFSGCKCLAFSISLAVSGVACLGHQLYVALVLYLLGLVGYVVTEIKEHRASANSHQSGADVDDKCRKGDEDKKGKENGCRSISPYCDVNELYQSANSDSESVKKDGSLVMSTCMTDDAIRQPLLSQKRDYITLRYH